jgi:hypothetical protein
MCKSEERIAKWQKLVETALVSYSENPNINAGCNIIRYSKNGLIKVSSDVDPNVFVQWYPCDQGFILLRLAKDKMLKFNADGVYGTKLLI